MRSTAGSCMSPDWPACSWTGPTPRGSSTNSVRCSTVACLPHRRSRRGRSKTAPRRTRRCWTVRPASSRCCCLPATERRHHRPRQRPPDDSPLCPRARHRQEQRSSVLLTDHHDEEIERLTGLGARPLNEITLPSAALPPGVAAARQTTFADPEGNEFDLVTWQLE